MRVGPDRGERRRRRSALHRRAAFLAAAAMAASCGACGACERPAAPPVVQPAPPAAPAPRPAPDALREPAPSFSIALLPLQKSRVDVKAAIAELAAKQFPRLKVQSPGEPVASLPAVIVGAYRSTGIGPEELSSAGRGLSPEARAAVARPVEATALEFHVPGQEALASLKQAQELAGALLQRVDGVLLDGETRELFAPQVWRTSRMGGWAGELPSVTSQVVLRRNGGDAAAPRLVSFGMAKFGLPDVAGAEQPGAPGPPLAARLHLLCQLLLEGGAPSEDGWMTLDASQVREATMRQALTEVGAGGPHQVLLRKMSPQPGDPDNRILELVPGP